MTNYFYYSQEVCLCDLDELWDMSFVLYKHMFVSFNCFINIMDKQYEREENDLILKIIKIHNALILFKTPVSLHLLL